MKLLYPSLLASVLLTGCISNDKVVLECTFPDAADTPAPNWVCDEQVEGYALNGVGYAKKNPAGIGFMKEIAANDARVKMAQTFRTRVAAAFQQSTSVVEMDDDTQTQTMIDRAVRNLTEQTLSGTRIVKTRTSPTGAIYTLVGMNEADYERTMKTAIKASKSQDAELWQMFKEDEAAKVLDGLIQSTKL